ncbi:glutamate-rich WD repeat-containing protein 1-like [Elysia marginata]|uniref:Glutamate-rich WD repeat-containing protein 1-like n=1 Tax=Elysia marginata TaxID=1093978 RepID=A0AAV4HS58_9GAST|nr:glutamate-rich WD repeat-containing protein 1-like [Elysia marginata]
MLFTASDGTMLLKYDWTCVFHRRSGNRKETLHNETKGKQSTHTDLFTLHSISMEEDEPMDTAGPSTMRKAGKKKKKKNKDPQNREVENGDDESGPPAVFIPGQEDIGEDEELVVDESAYVMLHEATTGDPCLSFEVLRDGLGDNRERFPLTAYVIGGSQSEMGHLNCIMLMKMFNMHKTQKEETKKDEGDEDDDDSTDEDEDDDNEGSTTGKQPKLHQTAIKHNGCVNRIKTTAINDRVISASWSENGTVYLYDVGSHIKLLDNSDTSMFEVSTVPPLFAFEGHQIEGYALAWSRFDRGCLLSGDCNKNIFKWQPTESSWQVDSRPFVGHSASVEDIKWSPKESNVFMTCSVDKSLRVWDARCNPSKACKLVANEAHLRDINVIDWSEFEPLVISGGDDGVIKIWDLRRFSVSIWDVAVERDDAGASGDDEPDIPSQLLFMHMGQKDIKEVHWHPQIPGLIISTAQSGFNVFRTISV